MFNEFIISKDVLVIKSILSKILNLRYKKTTVFYVFDFFYCFCKNVVYAFLSHTVFN